MSGTVEERLSRLERKVEEHDGLVQFMLLLAAKSPMGRKILARLAESGKVPV
jgi:hypothetical protein